MNNPHSILYIYTKLNAYDLYIGINLVEPKSQTILIHFLSGLPIREFYLLINPPRLAKHITYLKMDSIQKDKNRNSKQTLLLI